MAIDKNLPLSAVARRTHLARLLQMKGADVEPRNQGATLDLHHDSGLKALEQAQLSREFGSEELGAEHPEIDCGPLLDLLIRSLEFQDALQEQFRCGIDVVLDHFWGESAERVIIAGAKAGQEQSPSGSSISVR